VRIQSIAMSTGFLRVDEYRDPHARLHPRGVQLRHHLVEDGDIGLRRPRAVTLNPALELQHRRHVHVRPDLPDAVDGDGGAQACAVRQLRMPHHLHADLASVGHLVNPVGDVADLAEERRAPLCPSPIDDLRPSGSRTVMPGFATDPNIAPNGN
jgi:hypothetical protein